MTEVKVFRVIGRIMKPNYMTEFRREIRALKPEEAVERVYKEIGSRHKAKRVHIKVLKVDEISAEEITDPAVKKLVLGEKESVQP